RALFASDEFSGRPVAERGAPVNPSIALSAARRCTMSSSSPPEETARGPSSNAAEVVPSSPSCRPSSPSSPSIFPSFVIVARRSGSRSTSVRGPRRRGFASSVMTVCHRPVVGSLGLSSPGRTPRQQSVGDCVAAPEQAPHRAASPEGGLGRRDGGGRNAPGETRRGSSTANQPRRPSPAAPAARPEVLGGSDSALYSYARGARLDTPSSIAAPWSTGCVPPPPGVPPPYHLTLAGAERTLLTQH
ncbi:hypothetical protein THAOC_08575, partial [Thalassiosira oceanica]